MSKYKGYANQDLGNYDLAETLYLEYLAYEPQDETIFLRLGNMAFHQREFNKALEAYSHALNIKKNYKEAMINIGVVAKTLGVEETALAMAQTSEMKQRIMIEGAIEENPNRYSLDIDDDNYKSIPIFINARDRLECLRQQIDWLWEHEYHNIYILDNDSTYPPLLDYYKEIDSRINVLYLKKNLGYKALWESGILNVLNIQTPYVYTDPDIVPVEDCPADVLKIMLQTIKRYPYIKKVGFGLVTNDITIEGREAILAQEHQYTKTRLTADIYFGAVDTTFALYRNVRHYNAYASLRLNGNFMARHLPWYMNYQNLSADESYYAKHASDDYSTRKILKNKGVVSEKQLTSIILLSYNALDYTRLCLDSIRKNVKHVSYELIVVDNGSTDGSVEWLKEQDDVQCIFNEVNLGFPKGCNQGLKAANGTEMLLLNNDTIVTPGSLENMLAALYSKKDVGAVGCLTNNCSNYQTISLPYHSIEELMEKSEKFNKTDPAKWYPWMTLVGFCLLFKRDVYMRLGGLDETFSPGNYEDDDYCLRMRKAGYELLLCGDTYIHHFGSVSFKGGNDDLQRNIKAERYERLSERNRAYLIEKWKINGGYRSHYELVELLSEELKADHKVLLVNCDLGYDLYWLNRKITDVSLYGLTKDPIGVVITGKTFTLYVCKDFCEGFNEHYNSEIFDRIGLLGNSKEISNGNELLQLLRKNLTEDGLLFYGDEEHIYCMSAKN